MQIIDERLQKMLDEEKQKKFKILVTAPGLTDIENFDLQKYEGLRGIFSGELTKNEIISLSRVHGVENIEPDMEMHIL